MAYLFKPNSQGREKRSIRISSGRIINKYFFRFIFFLLLISLVPALFSFRIQGKKRLKIAVSKVSPNYINWLRKGDSTLVIINMFDLSLDSSLYLLKGCDGLVVTGGGDVHPSLYGKVTEIGLCTEINTHRDSLEQALIRDALALKMPVLGICRGEQILNVTLGGTLVIDIPSYFNRVENDGPRKADSDKPVNYSRQPLDGRPGHQGILHQCADYLACFHSVNIMQNTLLLSMTGIDTGFVNSNHHQAIDNLAPGLRCNARSKDGLIEGIEWEHPDHKSFLIGVQWHPERMDTSNVLSGKLVREFIDQSRKYAETIKKR